MIFPRATTAYLLILASLTLIPVSVILTTPSSHAMVPFASYQDLQEFIHSNGCASPTPTFYSRGALPAPTTATFGGAQSSSSNLSPNHSETNQQVSGVDELDTVKNDGQYVYTITNNTVAIVQAYPTTEAKLVAKVSVTGFLQGIFVVNNRLVIVSEISEFPYQYYGGGSKLPAVSTGVQPTGIATVYPYYFTGTTALFVVDISNHANPVITTRVDVNGTLAGARLIGNDVYLVASQSVYCYPKILLPELVVNGQVVPVLASEVNHSDVVDQGYSFTTILGIDTTESSPNPVAKIYLIGSTSTIYVSLHDIYLTQPVWTQGQRTVVHRITIDGLSINYLATGQVPGHVLNQFSMDEYNGYFRIATTNCCTQIVPLASSIVSPTFNQQETNVYVLDRNLRTVGKLEGLSPGEQIYSARFMGDKAYLVTYKRTDPLFVLGLKDPTDPTVLGQLNVTGVSDYLQPYDETHLIGIGQAGTDVAWENAVRFTGLKISLFNVTDPRNPSETSRYEMGGPGSTSLAISDHKAVLFDKSLNLLVIPVELTTQQNTTYWYSYQPVWQGAYVFNVTPSNGIIFKGGITQLQTSQSPLWQQSNLFVTRTLYIGNVLYTISNSRVQMNSLTDFSLVGSISLA